jgi:predicted esterase YcpF (UPF0227 family)
VILYLHGFTSGPQSFKARALHAHLARRGLADRFTCPQLPPSPAAAVALAESLIGPDTTLVGSSLGGFYATWLAERHGLRAVLINPAVVAHLSLERFVGPQRNLYTGEAFEFTQQHVDELKALTISAITKPERYWLLTEKGDELLDYRLAVTLYAGASQTVLEGGDHSFSRWSEYLDRIVAFAGL